MTYLINTITSWDEPPRTRHQVAQALAKNHKVYFIARNKFGVPKLTWNVINPNLTVIKPYFPVDYRIRYRMPVINETYQNWLFRKLSHSFKKPRVINFDHTATQIFKYFDDVVYYCNDEYLDKIRAKSQLVILYLTITEKIVIKQSLFCVGVYPYLVSKMLRYNPESHYIPIGGPSFNFNHQTRVDSTQQDALYQGYIALVGFIYSRLNYDWIKHLAVNFPLLRLLMIGPAEKKAKKRLSQFPNIEFVGTRTGDELFNLIADSKLCIAPYIMNKNITEIVTMPNKFWLYLSCGKPIVTCAIPNLDINEKFVYQSKNAKEFVDNIKRAMKEDNIDLRSQRLEFSRHNTWDVRIAALEKIYNSYG